MPLYDDIDNDGIPTTSAAESGFQVDEIGIQSVGCHVILNQACATLSRVDTSIKGYAFQKNFIENIASTVFGNAMPLVTPEAMMFPNIFFKMISECGSMVGALPSCFLAKAGSSYGFATPKEHIQSRLTNFSSSASTSPKYISFLYDILTNLTLNCKDSRIVLNRGLVVATNETGLEARGRNQSTLYDSIDSKLMVRNLCASQSFHVMHFF